MASIPKERSLCYHFLIFFVFSLQVRFPPNSQFESKQKQKLGALIGRFGLYAEKQSKHGI